MKFDDITTGPLNSMAGLIDLSDSFEDSMTTDTTIRLAFRAQPARQRAVRRRGG